MIVETRPLPPPDRGVLGNLKSVLDGDTRWNPATRRYEYVQLDRPARTGWRKRLFGQ
jgi:hypothetical protein